MRYIFHFFLLWWVLGSAASAIAQALYVGEQQVLTISPNTFVVLQGNLHNLGRIRNQGTIQLSGDWRNEQTYTDASGSAVILSGSGQTIDHRGQQFHHLTVRGGGAKELRSAVRIIDTLALDQGVVISAAATLTLEATASVSGGSSEAYVESVMIYNGTGQRHFPLGLDGVYLPLTLTNVTGEQPVLQVRVAAPNPVATLDESLASVSATRYWHIETVGGSYEGSAVALTVNQDDGLEDLLGAVVAQAAAPGGPFSNAGQSARSGSALQGAVTSEDVITQAVVAVGVTSLYSVENQVVVPSAFAPEAPDPVNRSVKVYAKTLLPDSFLFRIFDRWGNLVYQTNSLLQAQQQGWEGTRASDRSSAAAGVYQYHLRGVFENGSPVDQSGTISLFR